MFDATGSDVPRSRGEAAAIGAAATSPAKFEDASRKEGMIGTGDHSMVLHLDSETFNRLRAAARLESATLGDLVRFALTRHLDSIEVELAS